MEMFNAHSTSPLRSFGFSFLHFIALLFQYIYGFEFEKQEIGRGNRIAEVMADELKLCFGEILGSVGFDGRRCAGTCERNGKHVLVWITNRRWAEWDGAGRSGELVILVIIVEPITCLWARRSFQRDIYSNSIWLLKPLFRDEN